MTTEKLAQLRAKGFLLDPEYDKIAKVKDKTKKLSIKYIGSSDQTTTKISLKFEISASNLEKDVSKIYFGANLSVGKETQVSATELKIDKDGTIMTTFEITYIPQNDNLEYTATIICDGLSSEAEKIKLN
jgi:hypothetical protein